jgi:PAS domain S-box-containing protein
MTAYFHRKVWMGFIAAIGLIAWLAFSSYIQNKRFTETSRWLAHSNRVLYHTEQILTLTIDLEAGQRGYALTGNDEFLEPTNIATNNLETHIGTLAELTSDNISQQVRIRKLKQLVHEKLTFTSKVIETRKRDFSEAQQLSSTLVGKHLTDDIRKIIDEIQAEENTLLTARTQQTERRVRDFYTTFSLLLLVVVVILVLVFYSILINLRRRTLAEKALKNATDRIRDIYDYAPCGYHSLSADGLIVEMNKTWLTWLQRSRDEVIKKMRFTDVLAPESVETFKGNFQQFKKEGAIHDVQFQIIRKDKSVFRILLNAVAVYDQDGNFLQSRSTAIDYTSQHEALHKIESLNKELESFSYSVSHDLRAPLRSIDGYAQILVEDYAKNLDAEGNRLLNVVVSNARRMGKLVDDLLDFSRVGRKEITKTSVSCENLVHSIINEIKAEVAQRNITFEVGQLPAGQADASLLRQVWYNLISNAVKYTRKKEHAVISIVGETTDDSVVYTVCDNGTGFDMQYAPKLFGVFQRLHRQQDFEGTGVGLAIVHRIITRHGGRAWAEGKINEGAKFSFSLPMT